jgi:DNA-binding transcriptional regulator YiaG
LRKTTPEVIAAIDHLLESHSDAQAAKRLNEMGYGNWRQEPFTYLKVRRLRRAYKLSSREERLRARGYVTANEVAKQLGVCVATVHHWGGLGLLQREIYGGHHCLYLPVDQRKLVKPAIGRPRKAATINDCST